MPINNPFLEKGTNEFLSQLQDIKTAVISAVDSDNGTATIIWLSGQGGRIDVPLPMPMAGPGWGIYAMPTRGTLVTVGIRPMQKPVILGYFPMNLFAPESYFSRMRQEFAMFEDNTLLQEGEIYFRSRFSFSKCDSCQKFSKNSEFESNIDTTTKVERCPKCKAPAFELDPIGRITKANKRHIGSSIHFKNNGEIVFQQTDTLGTDLGDNKTADKIGLLKIIIGTNSDIVISDANDIVFGAKGDYNLVCNKFNLVCRESVNEKYIDKAIICQRTMTETYGANKITVEEEWSLDANSISIETEDDFGLSVKGNLEIDSENDFNLGFKNGFISVEEDLEFVISGDCSFGVAGNFFQLTGEGASDFVPILEAEFDSQGGNYGIASTKNLIFKVNSEWKALVTSLAHLESSANFKINGANVILNDGTKKVARDTDPTLANGGTNGTDIAFFQFLSDLVTFLGTMVSTINSNVTAFNAHQHAHPQGPTTALIGSSETTVSGTAPAAPAQLVGKINGGSNTVKAGD